MSVVSTPDVVNLFKKVYGNIHDLLPEDYELQKAIPFSEKQKVGESFVEAVILTNEVGWTLGGSSMTAFELNPASAGSVQQATVVPYSTVLASVVPWGVISRSAGGGEKAFYSATKHVVKNNLKSHGKLLEILRLYGQAPALLGYVSFYTGTYRGVSFSSGTGTLSINGTNVTFTNGVNTTSNWILFGQGSFAAGIWVGSEGVAIQEIDSTGAIIKEGKMVAVDPLQGAIQVDFTPTVASSTTSHRMCFKGQANASDMIGINAILSNTTTLFGISTTAYSLWKGNVINNNGQKLTLNGTPGISGQLTGIQGAVAQVVGRGGLDGDVDLYVNPRTWANLIVTESGLRMYDESYKPSSAENGFQAIQFWSQTGKLTVHAHRMIKEGECFGLHLPNWSRSGSAEIAFTIPGIPGEVIFPLSNQAAYGFRSFSDQYMFCHAPAKSFLINNINDEAA
jgi:hypothetical protein